MAAAFSGIAPRGTPTKLEPKSPNPSSLHSHNNPNSSTPTSSSIHPRFSLKPHPPTPNLPPLSIRPNSNITPSSATSPPNAPINKMSMASVISPDPTPPPQAMPRVSMTTKEWIIPPRPKPGRKPATDTPPTKRKAQNRAAQRAFRERRAARVGELEEQLDECKEEREKAERGLMEKIHTLELDLQSFRSKCSLLENLLEREREDRIRVENEAENLRRRQDISYTNNHSRTSSFQGSLHSQGFMSSGNGQFNHAPVSGANDNGPSTRTSMHSFAISQIISPPDHTDPLSNHTHLTCGNCVPNGPCACAEEAMRSIHSLGCGKCGPGTGCQCLEDVLNTVEPPSQPKRSSSPSNPMPSGKRTRLPVPQEPHSAIETDFTNAFKKKKTVAQPPATKPSQVPSEISMDVSPRANIRPKDRCGFCSDGTYCACADSGLSHAFGEPSASSHSLPSIFSQESQALSPPPEPDALPSPIPMEITATGAVKIRRRQKRPNSPAPTPTSTSTSDSRCGPGGPGTCAQCIADPQSGLFCRSLAAAKSSKGKGASAGAGAGEGGCCGGSGGPNGCCKTNKRPATQSIGISCADTYKTLSSHRNFDRAFEDIGTWLPKLKVVERPDKERPGRPAVEIDAASIMTTLKFLDVRFRSNRQ